LPTIFFFLSPRGYSPFNGIPTILLILVDFALDLSALSPDFPPFLLKIRCWTALIFLEHYFASFFWLRWYDPFCLYFPRDAPLSARLSSCLFLASFLQLFDCNLLSAC